MSKYGRRAISDLEKKRRAALRHKIKVDQLRQELLEFGDNKEEIEKMDRPGRRPKSLGERVSDARAKLDKMVAEIREMEKAEGVEHVPLEDVHDPLVDRGTVSKVGRKPKDQFVVLDKQLLDLERELAAVIQEWEEAGSDEPPVKAKTESGKPVGRRPKPYVQRVQELLSEIDYTKSELRQREQQLDRIGLMERQVKLLRDYARTVRKAIKQDEIAEDIGQGRLDDTNREIATINVRIDRARRGSEQGLTDDEPPIQLTRPTLLKQYVKEAEKLFQTQYREFRAHDDSDVESLRKKSERMDLLLEIERKKRELAELQREYKQIAGGDD